MNNVAGTGAGLSGALDDDDLNLSFERVMDELGIKDEGDRAAMLRQSKEAKVLLISQHSQMSQHNQQSSFPSYWVNVLRSGRISQRLIQRLRMTLSTQPMRWMSEFVELKGFKYLLEMHEDLFWRIYYHDKRNPDEPIDAIRATFLECTRCLNPIIRSQAGLEGLMEGQKNVIQSQMEHLVLSLASTDTNVTPIIAWALGRLLRDCGKGEQKRETVQTFWDALASLQILLGAKNMYQPLVRFLERNDIVTRERVMGLIILCVRGIKGSSEETIMLRRKHWAGFEDNGLALIKIVLTKTMSRDSTIGKQLVQWEAIKKRDDELLKNLSEKKVTVRSISFAIIDTPKDENSDGTGSSGYTEPIQIISMYLYAGDTSHAPKGQSDCYTTQLLVNDVQTGAGGADIDDSDSSDSDWSDDDDDEDGNDKGNKSTQCGVVQPKVDFYEMTGKREDEGEAKESPNQLGSYTEVIGIETGGKGADEASNKIMKILESRKEAEKRENSKKQSGDELRQSGKGVAMERVSDEAKPKKSSGEKHKVKRSGTKGSFKKKNKKDSEKDGKGKGPKQKAHEKLPDTKHDLVSLATQVKKGKIEKWDVVFSASSAPKSRFDPAMIVIDKKAIYIYSQSPPQPSAEVLPQQFPVDQGSGRPSSMRSIDLAAFAIVTAAASGNTDPLKPRTKWRIPLNDVVLVKEFVAMKTTEWEGRFGFLVKYEESGVAAQDLVLVASSAEEMQWWMRAIVINKGLSKEWNIEFQTVIESYRKALREKQELLVEEEEAEEKEKEKEREREKEKEKEKEREKERKEQEAAKNRNQLARSSRSKRQPARSSYTGKSVHMVQTEASLPLGLLVSEFTQTAEVLAQIIVDELHLLPDQKTIPPTQLGGVAGGEKYISHGILFKFATDIRGLYGGDEFAMKATAHEMKGLTAYIDYSLNSRFPATLSFPLMAVIDYKGYRLSAVSILPIDANTLIYGSADGGKTVHNDSKEMSTLMKKAGRALNIKSHRVVPLSASKTGAGEKIVICGPGDIEGHLGRDNRFYVLDTARVFPPALPVPELRNGFLFRLLRPELVKNNRVPLSSDAFSRWGFDPNDPNAFNASNAEVAEASRHMEEDIVPAFAARLKQYYYSQYSYLVQKEGKEELKFSRHWNYALEDSQMLVIEMHRAGINVRFLGLLRKSIAKSSQALRQWILMEIIARVLKNSLRKRLRENVGAGTESIQEMISTFLHPLFKTPVNTTAFIDASDLLLHFPRALTKGEKYDPTVIMRDMCVPALFLRVAKLLGIQLAQEVPSKLWTAFSGANDPSKSSDEWLSLAEVKQAIAKLSTTVTQLPLVSFLAAKRIEDQLHSYATIKKQQELMLLRVRDQYVAGLEMKSDDCDILFHLAAILTQVVEIRKDRIATELKGLNVEQERNAAQEQLERTLKLVERHYLEAINIDETRADILCAYASFLKDQFPDRSAEAQKYFTLAVRANPIDQFIKQKAEEAFPKVPAQAAVEQKPNAQTHERPSSLFSTLQSSLAKFKAARQTLVSAPSLVSSSNVATRSLGAQSPQPSNASASPTPNRKKSKKRFSKGNVQEFTISSPFSKFNDKLKVTLHRGRNLAAEDEGCKVYVALQLSGQRHTSKVKKQCSSPEWNQSFVFSTSKDSSSEVLDVKALKWETRELLGARTFSMEEVKGLANTTESWAALSESATTSNGELSFTFKWLSA